ncbi:MAG: hypothetical protein AB8G99_00900, partial [Planctomycetaceae bacterium]
MKSNKPSSKAKKQLDAIETCEPMILMSASPAADGATMDVQDAEMIGATDGADWIAGTDGNDMIEALGGDDTINAQIGENMIDGGDGIDTVVSYGQASTDFDITRYENGQVVIEGPGLNGGVNINTLENVERLEFSDGIIEIDSLPVTSGNGGSDDGGAGEPVDGAGEPVDGGGSDPVDGGGSDDPADDGSDDPIDDGGDSKP